MAEEQVIEQPDLNIPDPFDGSFEGPKPAEQVVEKVIEEKKIEDKPVIEPVEEVLDTKDYVKARFGWNSEEEGVEELRTLREKAQTPAEIKFANEQSKKFFDYVKDGKRDELYNHFHKEIQLERAEKLDLSNANNAAEVLRLALQYKYPDFTAEEIQDEFQEKYTKPAKPQQGELQTNEDYLADVDRWKQQCEAVDKRVIREAKMVRPELAKFKSELVLPDIPSKAQEQQQAEPTQEELAAQAQAKATYLKSMDTGLNTFTGYKITYKDEAVEIPISYDASPEEKAALKPAIEKLYSSYEEYFGPRWRNADGSINSAKVIEDIHLLENKGKVLQKFTNESGAQRLKQERKAKSNIEVEGTTQRTLVPDQKALQQKKEDAIWELS